MPMSPGTAVQKGFTLVELLIVVIILAILAAIVIPQFSSATDDTKEAALDSNLGGLRNAIELYKAQHATYPGATATNAGGTCTTKGSATAAGAQLAVPLQFTHAVGVIDGGPVQAHALVEVFVGAEPHLAVHRQITFAVELPKRRTENQASALEQTAASMEELSSTVRQNADNETTDGERTECDHESSHCSSAARTVSVVPVTSVTTTGVCGGIGSP